MKQRNLSQSILWLALATALILCVPFVAMQFTNEVKWSVNDFAIMGILIFSTGLLYILLTRALSNIVQRIAVALAIGSTFLLVWVNLAVGLIGSGANTANLMYAAVVAIVIAGTFLARFTMKGMNRVMFITAIALILIAVIQLLAKMYEYKGSSVAEIIGVNAFFATLFAVAGLLFRYKIIKDVPVNTNTIAKQ